MRSNRLSRSGVEGGRAALWLVVLLALGAVALLLVTDPLHLLGGGGARDGGSGDEASLGAGREAGTAAETTARKGVSLEGLYGAGDLGGVQLRVMDAAQKAPKAGVAVRLRARGGQSTDASTGPDGVAVFGKLAPGRGYSVSVEGTGFRTVVVEGVNVRPQAVTDLGDVWIGKNVVLRGRVLDPQGRPLPKASVAAFGSARANAAQGLVGYLVDQALAVPRADEEVSTDEEGWFRFLALADGAYALVAKHPGYGMRQQNDVVVSARSAASPLVIRLEAGAKMEGRVLDTEGRPVPGARIVALRDVGGMRFSMSGTLERDETRSDASGQYVLDTLVDGASYRFGVSADGFAGLWDQQPSEVQRVAERDFKLSRGGWIEGRVTEEGSGTPIADARITVIVGRVSMGGMGGGGRGGRGGRAGRAPGVPSAPSAEPAGEPTTPAVVRTDAEGRFKVGPLMPGPVMSAVIKAPGYTAASASMWTGNSWPDVSLDAPAQVDVQLKRGGAIEGRVTTPAGAPVAGANVVAVQAGNMGAMWVGSPAATTDAEGRYRMDGAPPGDYHLAVDAPGFALAATGEDATKVTVPPEGGSVAKDLTLSAAGLITGTVKDGKGEPVAGARVRTRPALGNLFRGGPGGGGAGAGARMVEALQTRADLTDAQGRFRLEGVGSAVEWTVEAEAEDYVLAQSARLKVLPGETKEVELVLAGGATLGGRVVGEGGTWVSGARVRVGTLEEAEAARPFLSAWEARRMLDPRVFFTDAEGRFLVPNLKPGRILVQVEQEGYVTYCKRNLTLSADQVLDSHMISLSKGEVVEGVVKGADGRPLAGALVFVTSRRNPGAQGANEAGGADTSESVEPQMSVQTDAEGRFRIENVAPGLWSVVVGFAAGHQGWFGANEESAIRRDVAVPARDMEFKLKVQEAPAGGGMPRLPGAGGAGGVRPPR